MLEHFTDDDFYDVLKVEYKFLQQDQKEDFEMSKLLWILVQGDMNVEILHTGTESMRDCRSTKYTLLCFATSYTFSIVSRQKFPF